MFEHQNYAEYSVSIIRICVMNENLLFETLQSGLNVFFALKRSYYSSFIRILKSIFGYPISDRFQYFLKSNYGYPKMYFRISINEIWIS